MLRIVDLNLHTLRESQGLGHGSTNRYLCGVLQGMLGIGAAVLGASHVLGIDLDPDALAIAQSNCEDFEDLPVC